MSNSEEEFASAESDSEEPTVSEEIPSVGKEDISDSKCESKEQESSVILTGEHIGHNSDVVEQEKEESQKQGEEEKEQQGKKLEESSTEEKTKIDSEETSQSESIDPGFVHVAEGSSERTTSDVPPEPHSTSSESGWGWGWGQSLWSTVGTAASKDPLGQLGQGISSVFQKVEAGLGMGGSAEEDKEGGAPKADDDKKETGTEEKHSSEPEQERNKVEEDKKEPIADQPSAVIGEQPSSPGSPREPQEPQEPQETAGQGGGFWGSFGIDFSSITEASKGLVTSGLDALENVGKKTIDILSDKNPQSGQPRSHIFGGKKSTLSELIREAQEKVEREEEEARNRHSTEDEISLSAYLDEYQGLAHFEALELLSKESESKLALMKTAIKLSPEQEETLERLRECFKDGNENEDNSNCPDVPAEVRRTFANFALPVKTDKVLSAVQRWREEAREEKDGDGKKNEQEEEDREGEEDQKEQPERQDDVETIFEHAMRSQGEVVSLSIELIRKTSELALLPSTQEVLSVQIAERLQRFTELIGQELTSLTESFAKLFRKHKESESQSFATALFLEAGHSCSHVQEGLLLTRPILEFRVYSLHKSTTD